MNQNVLAFLWQVSHCLLLISASNSFLDVMSCLKEQPSKGLEQVPVMPLLAVHIIHTVYIMIQVRSFVLSQFVFFFVWNSSGNLWRKTWRGLQTNRSLLSYSLSKNKNLQRSENNQWRDGVLPPGSWWFSNNRTSEMFLHNVLPHRNLPTVPIV